MICSVDPDTRDVTLTFSAKEADAVIQVLGRWHLVSRIIAGVRGRL